MSLLDDENPIVVSNAMSALNEINILGPSTENLL